MIDDIHNPADDRITVRFTRGRKPDVVARAAALGISESEYLRRLADDDLRRPIEKSRARKRGER